MAPEPTEPAIQVCATCGALIDVTDEEPLALLHCVTCGSALRVQRSFGPFQIQEVLGAGGMGTVYRALDTTLNRPVALKLLRRDHSGNPELIAQFASEAAITASINHPHVVRVYSTGTDHGIFYIAMELVDKGSLDDLMNLQGKVAEAQVLQVGIQIAQGLSAAQQRGLIHRDVKPGNILFADAQTSKIVDFGLAVLQEQANAGSGEVWGTPYYVAPEKLESVPHEDLRSDLYSLGASLFHAIAGRPPFEAETASMVALKHLKSQAVSLQAFAPGVSSATAYVINKSLSKDPDDRYQTYEEFAEHLLYARTELLDAHKNPRKPQRVVVGGEDEQQAMGWITFAMIAVIVIVGVIFFFYRDRFTRPATTGDANPGAAAHSAISVETRYDDLRTRLLAGQWTETAPAFRALDEQTNAPQPLRNWIALHAGLAYLLADQPEEARKDFQRIDERGVYTVDPAEQPLANFFMDAAHRAATVTPEPLEATADFDLTTFRSFGVLLLALKDWTLGAFDAAGPLLERFKTATPPPEYAWIEKYQPLADNYLADYHAWQSLSAAVRQATTPEQKRQVQTDLQNARLKLKVHGTLTDRFRELETLLDHELRTLAEAAARATAEQDAADTKLLADAKARAIPLLQAYRFAEAARTMSAVPVTGQKALAERTAWTKRAEWLTRFKATLIQDLNTTGYPQPILRRNGSTIPAGLHRASDAQAEMVTPYGTVPVPWLELTPESLIAIAQSFIRPGLPPALAADRQWALGTYAVFSGKKAEGLTLLKLAIASKPDYQPDLALFPELTP